MNVIAQLEFELAYYDFTVRHVSYYATWASPRKILAKTNFKSSKKNVTVLLYHQRTEKELQRINESGSTGVKVKRVNNKKNINFAYQVQVMPVLEKKQ